MRVAYCIAAIGVLISVVGAAEKTRDWQTGTVLDLQQTSQYIGVFGNPGTQTTAYAVYANFTIEGPTLTYVARERLRFKWNKAANLTINAPVKFAVEKRKLWVVDSDNKEHELDVMSQAAPQHALVQSTPSQTGLALSNADILKLKAAGLSDELIVGKIEASSGTGYRLGVDDLLSLKQQGLSDVVIQAMLHASQAK